MSGKHVPGKKEIKCLAIFPTNSNRIHLRQWEYNIVTQRYSRQHQHRCYFPHVTRHLIVQLQLFPRQRLQAIGSICHYLFYFQKCLHVLEKILHAVHEDAVDFHRCRKSFLQHFFIILHVVNVSSEYITLYICRYFVTSGRFSCIRLCLRRFWGCPSDRVLRRELLIWRLAAHNISFSQSINLPKYRSIDEREAILPGWIQQFR